MANSFYGYVTASRGAVLLGGVKHHKSSRFATQEQASAWVGQCVKANCEARRPPSAWGTTASGKPAEIGAEGDLAEDFTP